MKKNKVKIFICPGCGHLLWEYNYRKARVECSCGFMVSAPTMDQMSAVTGWIFVEAN